MRTGESEALLRTMLEGAGIALDPPRAGQVGDVFEVWRVFGLVPMDDLGKGAARHGRDTLLVRYGPDGDGWVLDLVRRFVPHGADASELHCTLRFDPAPALEAAGAWERSSHGLDHSDFRRQVQRSDGLRALAAGGFAPRSLELATRRAPSLQRPLRGR